MKKLLILALTLIPTSLQAQTYNQVQWGINKASSPYPVSVNVNNVWGQLGTLSAAGQWAIPTSNIVGPCGLSIFACANTWTALQTFTTTLLGTAPTIPTGFTAPLATWNSAYPGNTASADPFRFAVGGFPINNEFYGNPTVTPAGFHGVQALVGAIRSPVGATTSCGGAPCQDVGVAGYAQSLEASRASVAIFGEAGIGVDGAYPFGANLLAVNCKNHDASCTPGNAYNVTTANGLEVDVVAYDTPSGSPTGTFYGIQAVLNRGGGAGQTQSLAFAANPFGSGSQWNTSFQCSGGASVNCLNVGPTAQSGTSVNSQPINFVSINSGGSVLTNTLFQDSAGALQFNSNTGGYSYKLNTAYPQIQLIGVNNATVGQRISTSATLGAVAANTLQTGGSGSTLSMNLYDQANFQVIGGTSIGDIRFSLGSASPTEILTLTRDGGAKIGAPTGGDQGAGTLNATALYTNGGFFSASGTGAVVAKGNLTVGAVAGSTGAVAFTGTTSGVVTIKPQDTTNTYNFNLPTTVGTAGYLLTSQGGGASAMDWTSPTITINGTSCTLGSTCTTPTTTIPFPITVSGTVTSGGIPYFNSTTQMSSSAALGSGQIVLGGGAGAAPSTSANASIATGALTLGAAGTQGSVTMGGSTSGTLQIKPAAAAGTGSVLTLPGGTTDFSATGGTSQVVRQSTAGGALTVSQLAASDLSNGTTGSTSVVLSNTPTLTTPVLGAATGTSLALGTTLTSGQVLTVSGNTATSGYLYAGSTAAPTNTTSGDITGSRLSIGNGSLSAAGGLIRVEGNIGSATGGSYGMYYAPTLTNTVNLTNSMYAFFAYPATNMTGGAGNNTVTQFVGIGAGFQNPTAGTITNAYGFWASALLNQASITNSFGFRCDMTGGNCFYNSNSAASNVFAGKAAFGTTTAATYNVDVTGDINSTANYRVAGKVSVSATAPTFTSGFNTNGTISANNGTSAFRVTVGSGAAGSTGVIGMPTASTGWNCFASDITNPAANLPRVSAASTTSITLTNYNGANPPVATNWTNGDVIQVSCFAY